MSLTINDIPRIITNSQLPSGTAGTLYSQKLEVSGGSAPVTWICSGKLPDGLSFDSDGNIYGTPKAAGAFKFTVSVADKIGVTDTRTFSITINPEASLLAIDTIKLPDEDRKEVYSYTLEASGGVAPYKWELIEGSLPSGLSLDYDGAISGKLPNVHNVEYTFIVKLTDATGQYLTKEFSIMVCINQSITGRTPLTFTT
jgi:hypothetical protein